MREVPQLTMSEFTILHESTIITTLAHRVGVRVRVRNGVRVRVRVSVRVRESTIISTLAHKLSGAYP